MRPLEDRLFARYRRRRDPRLLARVFDRTAPALLRIARHTAPRRDLADDALQQTFLQAIEHADRWHERHRLFPWLVGILVNQSRLLQRSERRRPDAARLVAPAPPGPDDTAEAAELERAIAAAVADLGTTYRPVLHLHLFHGLNAKQIAAALDRPAGSVRTQLVRGLERLRNLLPVGLAIGLHTMAPVLAAMRRVVLERADRLRAGLDTAVATSTVPTLAVMTFGGSTMKKLALTGVLLLAVGLCTWPLWPDGDDATEPPQHAAHAVAATAPLADSSDRADAASLPPRLDRRTDATTSFDDARPGSLAVHVTAEDPDSGERAGACGVWVSLRPEREPDFDERLPGARTDRDGCARFATLPAGTWRVQAHLGSETARQNVTIVPGETARITLVTSWARFVDIAVVDEAGREVADAEIWCGLKFMGRMFPMQVTSRLAGHSDSRGRARIAAALWHFVGARKAGYAASASVPAPSGPSDALVLVLERRGGTIRGEVLYDDGRPIAGTTVLVTPVEPPATLLQTRRTADGREVAGTLPLFAHTDEQGAFVVEGLRPGTWRCYTDAANSMHDGVTIDVPADEVRAVRLLVPVPAYVTGRVVRDDGRSVAGLLLSAWHPLGSQIASSVPLPADGRFSLCVPAGPVRLRVKRGPERVVHEQEALASRAPSPLTVTVTEPLAVAGRVVTEDGAPLAEALVAVLPHDQAPDRDPMLTAFSLGDGVRTAEDGTFAIHGVDGGPFHVLAHVPGAGSMHNFLAPPVREGDGSAVDPGVTTVVHGVLAGRTDVELVLPDAVRSRTSLRLRVVDERGQPVAGARVTRRLTNGRSTPVPADGDGFAVRGLPRGPFSLTVRAAGLASRTLTGTIGPEPIDLGDIALAPGAELRVRPRLADGHGAWRGPPPIPIVQTVDGAKLTPQPTAHTDHGEVVLDGLAPGRFVLVPHGYDDLIAAPVPVHLIVGSPTRVDWPLSIGRELRLRFFVGRRPTAADRLRVTVHPVADGDAHHHDTPPAPDLDAFSLQHVFAPGTYRITAEHGDITWNWLLDTRRWPNGGTIDVPPTR